MATTELTLTEVPLPHMASMETATPITHPMASRGPIFSENSMPPTDGTIR